MADNTRAKPARRRFNLWTSRRKSRSPFRHRRGPGFRWGVVAALLTSFIATIGFLPERLQHGPLADKLGIGWMAVTFGTAVYAACLVLKERADFVAATVHAPHERDLLTYILALTHSRETVRDQAAQIVCELLGRLSVEELARIPGDYWQWLCPVPRDTPLGYSERGDADWKDRVQVAVFSAIMRLKRMQSLPYIESWMRHRSLGRHSLAFTRTLHACHATLLKHQEGLDPAVMLLRASSATATPDVLLRPASGTHATQTETGRQLLRASTGEDSGASNRVDVQSVSQTLHNT